MFAKLAGMSAIALLLGIVPVAEAAQGPQPNICVRSCWGARAPRANCIANMATLNRAVIHHTAGNEYASTGLESSKSYMRSIQNYHIDTRGWCDIAYHFLVDKYGNIFEGRWNSWSGLPQGSHDGVNINSFGFTWMGWFHPDKPGGADVPTTAMRNSLYDVIAWRMPSSWSPYGGGTYNARSCGWLTTHRDANPTACPGDLAYGYIGANQNAGEARDGVNARKNGTPPPAPSAWAFSASGEGWFSGNSLTPQIWTGDGWPGVLYADQTGNDAYMFGPMTSFAGGADASINVRVMPQAGNSASHDMQAFWSTTVEPNMDGTKMTPTVSYTKQNDWIQLNLNASNAKWSGKTISQLRLDYDGISKGSRWILDSVITQTTPKYWFGAGATGWTLGGGMANLGWISDATWPGCIYADQVGNDAGLFSPENLGYRGGANDQIVIRLYTQAANSSSHDIQIFWKTFWDPTWTEAKSRYQTYTLANDTWSIITIPVGANPNWSANDYIMQLRLDMDNVSKGGRWIIDYVAISQTTSSLLP